MAGVGSDTAGALAPPELLAMTWRRMVDPASASVNVYVEPMAPAMGTQLAPDASQRIHRSA